MGELGVGGVEEFGCCEGGEVPGVVSCWIVSLWVSGKGGGGLPGVTALVYVFGVAAYVGFVSV